MLLAMAKIVAREMLLPNLQLAILLLMASVSITSSAQAQPACSAHLPVYDAKGAHLQFRIVDVRPDTGEKDMDKIDLLHTEKGEYRLKADGETLYFSKAWIGGKAVRVTLEGPKGAKVYGRVRFLACEQRTSFRYRQLDTGFDVGWSTITGRLSGCEFMGDWWIRAMPMFGGPELSPSFEGYVRPDGRFSIDQGMDGVRHIIVVGKGNQPVKTFTVDVVVGGKNDAGTVDLHGLCPKVSGVNHNNTKRGRIAGRVSGR